jgi:hypothetical protein
VWDSHHNPHLHQLHPYRQHQTAARPRPPHIPQIPPSVFTAFRGLYSTPSPSSYTPLWGVLGSGPSCSTVADPNTPYAVSVPQGCSWWGSGALTLYAPFHTSCTFRAANSGSHHIPRQRTGWTRWTPLPPAAPLQALPQQLTAACTQHTSHTPHTVGHLHYFPPLSTL